MNDDIRAVGNAPREFTARSRELSALLTAPGNDDILESFCGLLEAGLPLFSAKVDAGSAEGADAEIVGFELTKWAEVYLIALRTRHVDPDEIVSGGHGPAPEKSHDGPSASVSKGRFA